ncbi:MAG: dephospho-CoA kinase [Planctomycetaceae bacterium]|nr:dephospho-CoA kinase [Planctomycetaceae bacterium]
MPRRTSIPVIGLVGGIGSGKSALTRITAERHNFVIVDADAIGHDVLRDPSVREAVRARFGDDIFDKRNQILRSALAHRVFGSSVEASSRRADLEAIVHPAIQKAILQQINTIRSDESAAGIFLDAAVMLEAGWTRVVDYIVFVEVPYEVRLKRVEETRNWDETELKKREASQLALEEKREQADFVLQNAADLESGAAQLEDIVSQILTGESDL